MSLVEVVDGLLLLSLGSVEGCLPVCPPHTVLDEVTQRCVYLEDCQYLDSHFLSVIKDTDMSSEN